MVKRNDSALLPSGLERPRRWFGSTVAAAHQGDGIDNQYALFRLTTSLEAAPTQAILHATADMRFKLWINGQFVGRGPMQAQDWFKYYESFDVTAHLQPGQNTLAFMVYSIGPRRPMLLADLVDGEGNVIASTSSQTRARIGNAWNRNGKRFGMNLYAPYPELFDARALPDNWSWSDFDDSDWLPANVVAGNAEHSRVVKPWVRLIPRDIPPLAEAPRHASAIERVEECLDLSFRTRPDDLAVAMSAASRPLEFARVEGAEHLLGDEGVTIVQSSVEHVEDHTFDGRHDAVVVLDFGRIINGYFSVDVELPMEDGTPVARGSNANGGGPLVWQGHGVRGGGGDRAIEIGYAERLIDGQFNNAIEGYFNDRVACRPGRTQWEAMAFRCFRYVKVRFRGFENPLTIHNLKARTTAYPFENRGRFESTDDRLNKVFDISRYTIGLCSNEFIVDTPWRETAQWTGDVAAVTLGGIYACFGDVHLPGKFFRQGAANQHPHGLLDNCTNVAPRPGAHTIPDYSLWWVLALWNHYQYTGDAQWLHRYYPHVLKILNYFLDSIDERGLACDVPMWVFVDWSNVDKRGAVAPVNALLYETLRVTAEIARLKGDSYTAQQHETVRDGIAAAFDEAFFNSELGVYMDCKVMGEKSQQTSEHANMTAIRFDLCDDKRAADIVDRLYETADVPYVEAQPFFCIVVLQALDQIGRFDLALQIMRDRWGKRMVDKGSTSVHEEWGINGSWRFGPYMGFMRTASHAWSAAPAEVLTRTLLGIEPLEPGFTKVRVNPRPTDFDYTIAYPTVHGPIMVTSRDGSISVEAPDGITIIGHARSR